MTLDEFAATWEKHRENEAEQFLRIEYPPFRQRDLCGLVKFAKILKSDRAFILSGARRTRAWLSGSVDQLAAVSTEDDIIYLLRCGVCYDKHQEQLYMFV